METESDTRGRVAIEERRPRYYALDLKRRIVEETFGPGQSVSVVARRHDVNANLVFAWRKRYRDGTLGKGDAGARARAASPTHDLIRVDVIDAGDALRPLGVGGNSSTATPSTNPKTAGVRHDYSAFGAGIIDIELPNRVKLRFPAAIDEAALRLVLAVTRQLP
ncbi:MAG: IS66-like element accessory protein TnpA [Bryobacteraceae bacterium]